jgi:hypothetical protein
MSEIGLGLVMGTGTSMRFVMPLEMRWEPKEDITTYELAKCLPYMIGRGSVMPHMIDKTETAYRHFKIIDHNK